MRHTKESTAPELRDPFRVAAILRECSEFKDCVPVPGTHVVLRPTEGVFLMVKRPRAPSCRCMVFPLSSFAYAREILQKYAGAALFMMEVLREGHGDPRILNDIGEARLARHLVLYTYDDRDKTIDPSKEPFHHIIYSFAQLMTFTLLLAEDHLNAHLLPHSRGTACMRRNVEQCIADSLRMPETADRAQEVAEYVRGRLLLLEQSDMFRDVAIMTLETVDRIRLLPYGKVRFDMPMALERGLLYQTLCDLLFRFRHMERNDRSLLVEFFFNLNVDVHFFHLYAVDYYMKIIRRLVHPASAKEREEMLGLWRTYRAMFGGLREPVPAWYCTPSAKLDGTKSGADRSVLRVAEELDRYIGPYI